VPASGPRIRSPGSGAPDHGATHTSSDYPNYNQGPRLLGAGPRLRYTTPPPPPSPISWASRINPAVSVKINPGHRGICYSTSIPGSAKIVAAQIRELLPDAHCLSDDPPIWAKKMKNMLTQWKRKNRGQTKIKVS
jgi:hypothetical protein